MNENEPVFKTVLYVDDKVVATSNSLTLWQSVLSSIKCNDSQPLNAINKSENKDNEGKAILSPIEKFAKENDNIRIYKINGQGEIHSYGIKQDEFENEVLIL